MKPELKQAIAARKLTDTATTLAKTAVELAAKHDQRAVAPHLHATMVSYPQFATLIQKAAVIYADNNPHVDARMEAGKKMLLAIASTNLEGSAEGLITLDLPQRGSFLEAEYERSSGVTDAFNSLMEFYLQGEAHAEGCAEALFKAIRFEHPTLSQSFLAGVRHAALATPENGQYLILGNAFGEGIPYI